MLEKAAAVSHTVPGNVKKNDERLVQRVRNAKLALVVGSICIGAAVAALIFLKKKKSSQ